MIDRRFIPIWQEAYHHDKELRKEARELGPGTMMRVERDLTQVARILKNLGAIWTQGQGMTKSLRQSLA